MLLPYFTDERTVVQEGSCLQGPYGSEAVELGLRSGLSQGSSHLANAQAASSIWKRQSAGFGHFYPVIPNSVLPPWGFHQSL